ncbi:hypothetical protein U3516DRAFT_735341 [Neocallimastix sp. 'constans']
MSVCLTAILKHQYRSTLRDPQGKTEPAIGGLLAILEELGTKAYQSEYRLTPNLSRKTPKGKIVKI